MKVAATGEDSGSFLLRNKWLAPQSSNQKLTVDQYGKFVRPTWTKAQSAQWTLSPHVKLPIDHSQRPASFSYCCDVWQAMPLSRHTTRSHAVKNTSWSNEETENMLTDKKELVTSGMKLSLRFQILSFCKQFKQLMPFCGSLMCCDRSLSPQFKRHVNWSSLPLY